MKLMQYRSCVAIGILLVLSGGIVWAKDPNLASTPAMGWNSWNHYACEVSDAVIRAQADALVATGMKAVGYTYVLIDDCWQGTRDAASYIRPNAKFPDMKSLANYVHTK